jgi:hypothetical protein
VDDLIHILQVESDKRAKAKRLFVIGFAVLMVLAAMMVVADWIKTGRFPDEMLSSFSSFIALAGGTAGIAANHRKALEMAARSDDPRLTVYLLEASSIDSPSVAAMAQSSLLTRLQLVRDPEAVPPSDRLWLYKALGRSRSNRFATAVLEAMRRVGDREAIPFLEAFVESTPPDSMSPALRRFTKGGKRWSESTIVLARTVLGDVRMRVAKGIIEEQQARNQIGASLVDALSEGHRVNETSA